MSTAYRRSRSSGWILAVIAAVFAAIALAIVVSIARVAPGELLAPGFMMLAGAPLAGALGIGFVARRHLRSQPVMLALDATGVTVGGGPAIAWAELGALVHRSVILGYGPREHLVFRRRFSPSDIAAKRAERLVQALFTDRSVAPDRLDTTVEALLAEIDRHLAAAGLARVEPPGRRFGVATVSRTWTIAPVARPNTT